MATAHRLPAEDAAFADVAAYLEAVQRKTLLRLLTCGSVDDGKSTLLGRLLFDSKAILDDQLAALEGDSRRWGTQGQALDLALLVDGLAAEREQGITIDVAYRFFATEKRKFIVADTPGHEQYTRNMVTGASTADLAIILIDARKGVLTQTRRHSTIVKLLGIRHVVVAVNKMDLVDYSQDRFDAIVADYREFADQIGVDQFTAIPLSALTGENIGAASERMPWYDGRALLDHLEQVDVGTIGNEATGFTLPVQWVNRPNSSFRGYSGRIGGGSIRPGDAVKVLPSGKRSTVARIVTMDGDLARGIDGQSVTLTLTDEVDCSRGEVIVRANSDVQTTRRLTANLVWMAENPFVPGRSYWLKIGAATVSARIERINHLIDVNAGGQERGRPLALNDIAQVELMLDRPIAAQPYQASRTLGAFILIDKTDRATTAAGMIESLATDATADQGESSHIFWVPDDQVGSARVRLQSSGRPVFVLDDATLREGISSDLAEGEVAFEEHLRRARATAVLMSRAGVNVIVALDVPAEEQWPGRSFAGGSEESDEWVI